MKSSSVFFIPILKSCEEIVAHIYLRLDNSVTMYSYTRWNNYFLILIIIKITTQIVRLFIIVKQKNNCIKLRDFSPQANYTDRETAAYLRNLCQILGERVPRDQRNGSPGTLISVF
jgi:hypothetical protein